MLCGGWRSVHNRMSKHNKFKSFTNWGGTSSCTAYKTSRPICLELEHDQTGDRGIHTSPAADGSDIGSIDTRDFRDTGRIENLSPRLRKFSNCRGDKCSASQLLRSICRHTVANALQCACHGIAMHRTLFASASARQCTTASR